MKSRVLRNPLFFPGLLLLFFVLATVVSVLVLTKDYRAISQARPAPPPPAIAQNDARVRYETLEEVFEARMRAWQLRCVWSASLLGTLGLLTLWGGYTSLRQRQLLDQARETLALRERYYRALAEHFPSGIILLYGRDGRIAVAAGQGLRALDLCDTPMEGRLPESLFPEEMAHSFSHHRALALRGQRSSFTAGMRDRIFHVHTQPIIDSRGEVEAGMAVFSDITLREEQAAALLQAKEAAEVACEMKNQFVANISHELRTPISGIMGITEMALAEQPPATWHRYFSVIRNVSEGLVGVINDVLDFSRIEADKLSLESRPYDLRALLSDILEPMRLRAEAKGLALRLDIDDPIAPWVIGDPGRLRQVLVNLVDNAIKFTDAGQVLIRLTHGPDSPGGHTAMNAPQHASSVGGGGIGGDGDANIRNLFEPARQERASRPDAAAKPHIPDGENHPATNAPDHSDTTESEDTRQNATQIVHFSITDTGIGIPANKQTSLFTSFSQLDGSLSRQHGGSGLGLSICKQLVSMMGGTLLVDSLPGTGSNFYFSLRMPLHEQTQPITDTPRPPAQRVTPAKGSLPPPSQHETPCPAALRVPTDLPPAALSFQTVLLAEDNELNREFLVYFLRQRGHTVLLANTGVEVLEIVLANGASADNASASPQAGSLETPPSSPPDTPPVPAPAVSSRISAPAMSNSIPARPDIILMDVQMPIMSGLEATRQIREAQAPYSAIPIVALTAHAMSGDRERFLAAGMDAFVGKPVDRQALYAALETAWSQAVQRGWTAQGTTSTAFPA